MKKTDAFSFFGGKPQIAEALGIQLSSVYDWGDLVPFPRQQQIEALTKGKLKAMTYGQFLAAKYPSNKKRKAA